MDTKVCNTCLQEYPATSEYFYKRVDGYLFNDCKTCFKEKRKDYRPKREAVHKGEILAIERLLAEGIFAATGKRSSWTRYIDVICWGCIKIEVKYSLEQGHYPHWLWSLRSTSNSNTDKPDFILLIGEHKSGERHYYLFPVEHPVFFINGKRKLGIKYTLYQVNEIDKGHEALKSWLMDIHENAFHQIEDLRLEKIQQLRQQALLQQNQ